MGTNSYQLVISQIIASCYSVFQSCLTLCDPIGCSSPGFPILHFLPEFAQTHVYWADDAVKPFQPLLSPSPPAFSLSQHTGHTGQLKLKYSVSLPECLVRCSAWRICRKEVDAVASGPIESLRVAGFRFSQSSESCFGGWRWCSDLKELETGDTIICILNSSLALFWPHFETLL